MSISNRLHFKLIIEHTHGRERILGRQFQCAQIWERNLRLADDFHNLGSHRSCGAPEQHALRWGKYLEQLAIHVHYPDLNLIRLHERELAFYYVRPLLDQAIDPHAPEDEIAHVVPLKFQRHPWCNEHAMFAGREDRLEPAILDNQDPLLAPN